MLTSQSTLSTIILGLSLTAHCVKAYTTTLNSTQLAPSSGLVPPLVTGPVALNQMLPLKLYVGAGNTPGAGQYSETTDLQNSLCSNGGGSNGVNYDLQSHSYNAIRSTANIYLIYFTAGQISGNQQALIQNFVTNIGSTNYWNTVRQYIYNGYIPATPSYQNSVVVSPYSTIGMSMTENNAQDLLLYVFTKVNSGFKDYNGIYMIILGTDITFISKTGNVMGKGSGGGQNIYCGMHDVYNCRMSLGNNCWISGDIDYSYSVIGMPKSPSTGDKCNVFAFQTPNGDASLDNTINFIAHELVEAVISYPYAPLYDTCDGYNSCNGAWTDVCSLQACDKCANIVSNLVFFTTNPPPSIPSTISFGTVSSWGLYNLVVNGQRYVVQPIYDNNSHKCSMGGNTQMLNPSNVEIMSAWNFRCIDQTGWSTANGIVMQIYGCTGWSNQRWNFNSDKSISIGNGGSCLDLQNGVIGNGTPIQQWTCYSGSKNQQWIYSSSDLTIRLAANTNYCLDINNSLSGANGSKLQIWSCTGGSNQKWYLVQ